VILKTDLIKGDKSKIAKILTTTKRKTAIAPLIHLAVSAKEVSFL